LKVKTGILIADDVLRGREKNHEIKKARSFAGTGFKNEYIGY
jgi:hypothetical protein